MRSHRQLFFVCLVVVFGLIAAACGSDQKAVPSPDGEETSETLVEDDPNTPRTTMVPTMQPTSAEDLGIALDRSGQPYDNYWGPEGATAETRLLTKLQVPDGRIELVEGEAFQGLAPVTSRDTTTIDFRDSGEFDLQIVWEQPRSEASDSPADETILGVFIGLSSSPVSRWGQFATAYVSSEGIGGITTRSVLDRAARDPELGEPLIGRKFVDGRPFIFVDLDTEPGNDTVLFDHGVGIGSRDFSYTRGFDEDDHLVAIMIWDPRFPWRLAVSQGTPPPDVTEREEQLRDCIEGRRLIDKWGRCT